MMRTLRAASREVLDGNTAESGIDSGRSDPDQRSLLRDKDKLHLLTLRALKALKDE